MDKHYEFTIKGTGGVYNATFDVKEGRTFTTCTCRAGLGEGLCWHRSYILSGNESEIINNDRSSQVQLILDALTTKNGQLMVLNANDKFPPGSSGKKRRPRREENIAPRKRSWPAWLIVLVVLAILISLTITAMKMI